MKKYILFLLPILLFQVAWGQKIIEKDGKFGLTDYDDETVVVKPEYQHIFGGSDAIWLICQFDPDYTGSNAQQKHDLEKLKQLSTKFKVEDIILNITFGGEDASFPFLPNMVYGLVTEDMKNPIPAKYKEVYITEDYEHFIVKTKDGFYYEYDLFGKGKINKKTKSEAIEKLSGAYKFKKDGKWGVKDEFTFEVITKPIYTKIKPSEFKQDIYLCYQGNEFQFAFADGWETYPERPLQAHTYINVDGREACSLAKQNGKWGILNHNDRYWLLSPKFQNLRYYSTDNLFAQSGGKWGIVDWEGNTVIDFQYEDIQEGYGNFFYVKEDGKYGVYSLDGEKIYDQYDGFKFDSLVYSQDAEQHIIYNDGKKGLFSKHSGIQIPAKFDDLIFPYVKENEKDVFDDFGEEISNTVNWIKTILNGKTGLYGEDVDGQMQEMLPTEFDNIKDFSDNHDRFSLLLLQKDSKWGIYNKDNQLTDVKYEYDAFKEERTPDGSFIVQKEGKWGIVSSNGNEKYLDFEYEDIVLQKGKSTFSLKKDGKWGRNEIILGEDISSNLTTEITKLVPLEYESVEVFPNLPDYTIVEKNGKFGLLNKEGKSILKPEFDEISFESKLTVKIKKDGKLGSAALNTGNVLYKKGIEDLFTLKWKANVGQTTFRTNIMFANKQLVIGSNGTERNKADAQDGLHFLNPNTGETSLLIRPQSEGKIDVNGQAIDGNKVFFGNENGKAFCYDFTGKQLWQADIKGKVESSPSLADLNGDGTKDAVFATQLGWLYALDGKTGAEIWAHQDPEGGFFMATPACYDISDDGVADILIGAGGRPYFYAINGKNGETLWRFRTKSTAGFVNGSGVHASASVLLEKGKKPQIIATESYGIIHYLDTKGKWEKYIANTIGIFSSPVFSADGMMVNGASWMGKGNVDVTIIREESDWAYQEKGEVYYATRKTQLDGSPAAKVSASAFMADVLGNGSYQAGIADEAGKFQLINRDGVVEEILELPAGVEASIFVADIDGDGMLEIVVACLDGNVYCYDTRSKGKVFWGQFRGDNANTGVIQR